MYHGPTRAGSSLELENWELVLQKGKAQPKPNEQSMLPRGCVCSSLLLRVLPCQKKWCFSTLLAFADFSLVAFAVVLQFCTGDGWHCSGEGNGVFR